MKRFVLLSLLSVFFLSAICTTAFAQSGERRKRKKRVDLFTQPSLEQAWQTAVAEQKPLMVMFSTEGCVYCRKMLSETYGNSVVQELLSDGAVTVLANASEHRGLVKKLGIRGYPTSMLVSPSGQVLDFMEGYVDAKAFAQRVGPLLSRLPSNSTATVASQTTER